MRGKDIHAVKLLSLPYLYAPKCIHLSVVSLCSFEKEGALVLVLAIPNEFNDLNRERKKIRKALLLSHSLESLELCYYLHMLW